ncbi:host nuclease inhibitor protein [Brenneria goodwinii]|uniref:Host nuclease inhibitor protein n=1 Tax=Brenneria goodwinii TaxID=1109412 RepID=A0AAE8JN83_9GAMM|nr:host nuclease inhibitor protein [Brenneria goodwinii]ATA26609.1 host nuclease inhibitor protein [Brenneria goodwinii]RLM25407.1 host nuclease inhibitor protein [Brenneria goodwinii]
MKLIAYAWASGLIEFGKTLPDGALPVIRGQDSAVREAIDVIARHSRVNDDLLVPGIPESDSQHEACDALIRFTSRVKETYDRIVSRGNDHE